MFPTSDNASRSNDSPVPSPKLAASIHFHSVSVSTAGRGVDKALAQMPHYLLRPPCHSCSPQHAAPRCQQCCSSCARKTTNLARRRPPSVYTNKPDSEAPPTDHRVASTQIRTTSPLHPEPVGHDSQTSHRTASHLWRRAIPSGKCYPAPTSLRYPNTPAPPPGSSP